jgi:hypothetical protein
MTRRRPDVNEKRSAEDIEDWDSRETAVKAWIENLVCYLSLVTGDSEHCISNEFSIQVGE